VNQAWNDFFQNLNSPGGRIAVLLALLVIGLVAVGFHLPYAEHIVLATLAVLLVALR